MAKFTKQAEVILEAKYLKAELGVRYWEDATVNGVSDEDGELIPFRHGEAWCPTIDLDAGIIVDWPDGVTADIHYKVCDDGKYAILDSEGRTLKEYEGYVPSMLSPKESGHGDYVIMDVGPDGKIDKFKADLTPFENDDV